MKYVIEGKTYKSLKQIRDELSFYKYKVKEGQILNWWDTNTVFSIFSSFGEDVSGFTCVVIMRRTTGGRVINAMNPDTLREKVLSVSSVIKKSCFVVEE